MSLSRSRTITFVVALAALVSNTLSSVLFSELPDDPHHLASKFGWYLHFSNFLCLFGLVGAIRQHGPSITIFSNYLLLDTLLSCVPRFLAVSLLNQLSTTICDSPAPHSTSVTSDQTVYSNTKSATIKTHDYEGGQSMTDSWTPQTCFRIIYLTQLTLAAGVIAATLLQFVGALAVRGYACALWKKDRRERRERRERRLEHARKIKYEQVHRKELSEASSTAQQMAFEKRSLMRAMKDERDYFARTKNIVRKPCREPLEQSCVCSSDDDDDDDDDVD